MPIALLKSTLKVRKRNLALWIKTHTLLMKDKPEQLFKSVEKKNKGI